MHENCDYLFNNIKLIESNLVDKIESTQNVNMQAFVGKSV